MTFHIDDPEWAHLSGLPADDAVDLAADLGLLLPAPPFHLRDLLDRCVPAMVERARADGGLPLSKYDLDDLRELSGPDRDAVARVCGLGAGANPEAIVKVGDRIYRARSKNRRGKDPYAFMVPILLGPIVRCLRAGA